MAWGHTCCRNYNKNTKTCGAIKPGQSSSNKSNRSGQKRRNHATIIKAKRANKNKNKAQVALLSGKKTLQNP